MAVLDADDDDGESGLEEQPARPEATRTAISATIFLVSVSWTLITVKILENITELSLGPAAAFSVLVVVIVFVAMAVIGCVMRLFRAPGVVPVTGLLGG